MTPPPDFLSGEYSSAVVVWQIKLAGAQSAKVESGFASGRAPMKMDAASLPQN
jgi:hypothetical protein